MLRDRAVQDRLEVRSNRHCPVAAADANENWQTRFRKQRFESSSSRLQSFPVTFELLRVNVQQSATKESESIAERIRGSISSRQPEQLVRECVTAGRLLGPISRLLEPVWRTGERGKRLSRVVLRRIAGAMMLRDLSGNCSPSVMRVIDRSSFEISLIYERCAFGSSSRPSPIPPRNFHSSSASNQIPNLRYAQLCRIRKKTSLTEKT